MPSGLSTTWLRNIADRAWGPCSLLRRLPRLVTYQENKRGIAFSARLYHPKNLHAHASALINHNVTIHSPRHTVRIGEHSQINFNSVIFGGSGVSIGDRVMVGPNCTLAAGNHDYKQTNTPIRFAGALSRGPITIEDDVWLGASVVVTDGVTIGRGSVIGAGAVVTRDIPPMSVAAGVPARVIQMRASAQHADGQEAA